MKNKKHRIWYLSISIITIIILSILIIISMMNIYGKSSKQVRESYEFLHKLQYIEAISTDIEIKKEDFQEVTRSNELSNVKYSLVYGDYGIDLNENYEVVGFSNQNVKIQYKKELTSEECVEYARRYLKKIYGNDFKFKEIKDKDAIDSPVYTIAFYKTKNKYVCYSNEILLKIDKYDGNLIGYSNYSDNRNVKFSSDINISEEECEKIFNNFISELGINDIELDKIEVGYINISDEENQLCYVITYRITDGDNKDKLNNIIINSKTGEVVKHSNNIVELISAGN